MGGLFLFLSSRTAAALASMLLFTFCLNLSSVLEREKTEEAVGIAQGMMGVLEMVSLLPGEGRVEILLPIKEELKLKGRMSNGKQLLEIWSGGKLLLSSLLPLPIENGSFEEAFSNPCLFAVIKRENSLILERR
ncbi:MAG: hypothetical protein QXF66_01625 [Candidatus Hadarchaeales archaeon]